ncbi:hypothetical protein B0O80DRAFT_458511 [Mortierella sp. GBAus27b]|nr:hypothetical protein BGX31_011525 [Mortierella sp. GBA43]KAI8350253.1 hypothetical protein B0O80DRAFT_458511 [Mortierella sp. GBAus27b]
MSSSRRSSPLDLPEIRDRLSRFVQFKDAFSCILVNRNWYQTFVQVIWHTVNIATNSGFKNLEPSLLEKRGRLLKVVSVTATNLTTINHPSISSLQSLTVVGRPGFRSQSCLYNIICRNITAISHLVLHLKPISVSPRQSGSANWTYISFDVFENRTTSNLTTLDLTGVAASRRSFSSILRASPKLETLTLVDTVLYEFTADSRYEHYERIIIIASLEQMFNPDPEVPDAPSLFIHFPFPNCWRITDSTSMGHPIMTATRAGLDKIRRTLKADCPCLTSIVMDASGPMVAKVLAHGFNRLHEIRIHHEAMDGNVVAAILAHQDSLFKISTLLPNLDIFNANEPTPLDQDTENDRDSSDMTWMWQLIPRCCPYLMRIELPNYEMDMDEAEKTLWRCKTLITLRIRIRGLDTKQKIEEAIKLWVTGRTIADTNTSRTLKRHMGDCDTDVESDDGEGAEGNEVEGGKQKEKKRSIKRIKMNDESTGDCGSDMDGDEGGDENQQQNGQSEDLMSPTNNNGENKTNDSLSGDWGDEYSKTDHAIEARVARHLLKFDHLVIVWLGTKTFHLQDKNTWSHLMVSSRV